MAQTTDPATQTRIARQIAADIAATPQQVTAAVDLLDGGATVPFVARYRKEATGGLDDTQLRRLADRLDYLRDLEARRAAILTSIADQGKLTPGLEARLKAADTKAVLEDLYLPFRPKRRTRAMIARENGLAPLAQAILANRRAEPAALAQAYLTDTVPDTDAALSGARDILAETLAENADLLGRLRDFLGREAVLSATVAKGQEAAGAKYSDYFAHAEPYAKTPGHRALAMLRGAREKILSLDIGPDPDAGLPRVQAMLRAAVPVQGDSLPGDRWLAAAADWT